MSGRNLILRGGPFNNSSHFLPLGKQGTLEFIAKGERGSYQQPHHSSPFLEWQPAQAAA